VTDEDAGDANAPAVGQTGPSMPTRPARRSGLGVRLGLGVAAVLTLVGGPAMAVRESADRGP
jgi:hypothetical protein